MTGPIETQAIITTLSTPSRRMRIAGMLLGLGTLAGTIACGTQAAPQPEPQLQQQAQAPTSQQVSAGAMSVNCGARQQAIIRPSTMNGQAVSQVECVPAPPLAPVSAGEAMSPVYAAPANAAPVPVAPVPVAAVSVTPVPVALVPATLVPVAPVSVATAPAAAVPVSYAASYAPSRMVGGTDYVAYRPRVIRRVRHRSVQKSAVIIGSSAGIGAAIGGAIKGGKGALIGAAIGGGGAALWDQATRHNR
jgi:hypothetical protein